MEKTLNLLKTMLGWNLLPTLLPAGINLCWIKKPN